MNKAETVAGGMFTAIGVLMLLESLKFPYFLDGVPGPGFLPRWIAAGLIGTGAILTVKAIRPDVALREAIQWPDASGWWRIAIMLGAMAFALLLLDKLGFVIVVTVFMAVVMSCMGVRSWRMLATVPILTAVGLYVVFAVGLQVPLPKGVLVFFE
jgi:hypothetical protein